MLRALVTDSHRGSILGYLNVCPRGWQELNLMATNINSHRQEVVLLLGEDGVAWLQVTVTRHKRPAGPRMVGEGHVVQGGDLGRGLLAQI